MRNLFVILLFVCCISATGQSYEVPLSGYQVGWGLGYTIQGATVEPDRIIIHTRHHNKFQTRTLQIPSSMLLYVPSLYREFPVTAINGASWGVNSFKSNRKYDIDFVVKMGWDDLIAYSDNPLFVMDILTMRLTTNKDFASPQPDYNSSDWRFDIRLPLNYEQLLTLGAGSYFSSLLVKDEFETSARYAERTQADSLKPRISKRIQYLSTALIKNDLARIDKLIPTLTYNADTELLTISYANPLIQPIQIKAPAAQAKEIKDAVTGGQKYFRIGAASLSANGGILASAMSLYDRKDQFKTKSFKNELAGDVRENIDAVTTKIMGELVKKHVSGRLLK